jgi:hypothetical protein
VDYLVRLIQQRPDWFLNELLNLLKTNRFISIHYVTVHRTLLRAGVSLKKLKKVASERDEDRRNEFINRMAMYEPEELAFLDETSKNEKTAARTRGRARKGHRAIMKQRFVRGRRLSATGLLTIDGIVVSKVIEGSMTKDLYINFLEYEVVCAFFFTSIIVTTRTNLDKPKMPLCSAYPGPLSVLVMDNAHIHHGVEILELADRFGEFTQFICLVYANMRHNRCTH